MSRLHTPLAVMVLLASCGTETDARDPLPTGPPGDPPDVAGVWDGTFQSSYGVSGTFTARVGPIFAASSSRNGSTSVTTT